MERFDVGLGSQYLHRRGELFAGFAVADPNQSASHHHMTLLGVILAGLTVHGPAGGITVAGTPERGAVLAQVRSLLEFGRQHGYGRREIIQMISDLPQDA